MKISQGSNTTTIKVNSWEEARLIGNHLNRWLFRGQANSQWLLKSTVERALEFRNIPPTHRRAFELLVLSKFREVAHNYINYTPEDEDTIGWLTLIQHYGGPTRLLDFTKSFYIATYFALDGAENECAIWAINRPELMKILPNIIETLANNIGEQTTNLHKKISAILYASITDSLRENIVLTASPLKLSKRQFTQKGIPLIPLNLHDGYMESLLGSFQNNCVIPNEKQFIETDRNSFLKIVNSNNLIKIILPKSSFLDARIDLDSMNLNAFNLFGGLDGLGKDLSAILNSVELVEKLKILK